ncbi:MSMB protein, partial [Trogon melanurus]|nr:MSMB protein [Trogon melanurus]
CRDSEGELHEIGSSWRTNDCLRCSCLKDGIDCCTDYATPSDYDREKCISIFNKVTCTYKVVEKDDHSKVCPVRGWVA